MLGHQRGDGVLVALHGHGDEPGTAQEWGRAIAPPGWEVVAPGAPPGDDGVRSWFPTGPRGVPAEELSAVVARIGELVDRVRAEGRPVVVAGFSQGGAVSLSLPLHGVAPDAIVACCTFLPEVERGDGPGADRVAKVPVLVVGTEHDEDVPPFLGEDAAAFLDSVGVPATSVVLPGGHEVGPAVRERAAAWLAEVLHVGARVSIGLPVDRVEHGAELVSGEAVAELSAAFERLGYDALYVTDHPAPDDRWLAAGGHQALEPTAVLSAAAIATSRMRLHTNVYVLPYRNPFLGAKALASVDVLSHGRLIVGVAAGYLRPEFAALGADFDGRADRLDEALEWLPRIWSGERVEGSGEGWHARGATVLPRPVQQPHPPIWVGGNSTAAMRRAVRSAQGWSPFPTAPGAAKGLRTAEISDLDGLRARLDRLRELGEEAGRTEPLTVCFAPFGGEAYRRDPDGRLPAMVEEVGELVDLGVDWVVVSAPGATRAEVCDRAAELAGALGLRAAAS